MSELISTYFGNSGSSGAQELITVEATIGSTTQVTPTGATTISGLTDGSDTFISPEFVDAQVEVFFGNIPIPSYDQGDGGIYYTKVLSSDTITLSQPLATDDTIKIKIFGPIGTGGGGGGSQDLASVLSTGSSTGGTAIRANAINEDLLENSNSLPILSVGAIGEPIINDQDGNSVICITDEKIGVGTLAPVKTLHLVGDLRLELSSGTSAGKVLKCGASGDATWEAPSEITIGSSVILSGINTRVLFNNSGFIDEYNVSGTGNVAMTTSPTFTTPNLGTPSSLTLTNATGLNANTGLTGTTLNNSVVNSSLTSVGTIATGTWQASVISSTYGGTGVNNAGRTLTINTNSGTLAFPASSTVMTFPSTSATIARTDTAQTFSGFNTFTSGLQVGSGATFQSTQNAGNNFFIQFNASSNTGGSINRSVNDTNSVLEIKQHHASSTGNIVDFSNSTGIVSVVTRNGNIGIGSSTVNASAALEITSTSQGVLFPRMTTAQKNAISSPAAGLVVFDTTLSKLCIYTGAAWQTVTST